MWILHCSNHVFSCAQYDIFQCVFLKIEFWLQLLLMPDLWSLSHIVFGNISNPFLNKIFLTSLRLSSGFSPNEYNSFVLTFRWHVIPSSSWLIIYVSNFFIMIRLPNTTVQFVFILFFFNSPFGPFEMFLTQITHFFLDHGTMWHIKMVRKPDRISCVSDSNWTCVNLQNK